MKKVFSSQSQLCHVWANQSQSEGRTNNMYFCDSMIFSYGEHYMAAKVHKVKGKRFALVRSDTYGPATSGHLTEIRNSLSGLMPYYCVPCIESPKDAVKVLDSRAAETVVDALKRVKVDSKDSVKYMLENINEAFKDASELRSILGLKAIKPKVSDLNAVKKHFAARFKRYQELQTPEMQAKRERDRAKRAEKQAKVDALKEQYKIEAFRNGNHVSLYNLKFELLRVQGNEVVTSRGARVPLDAAVTLYRAIETGRNVIGAEVGSFKVEAITNLETDKVVKIGCHNILWSEASRVLSLKQVA